MATTLTCTVTGMDPNPELGSRLRRQRERLNLSLMELADAAGVSKTYLLRLETDQDANPSLDILRRMADALDTTIADLVGGPAVRFRADEAEIPASLRAFADEVKLTEREFELLASIRWRKAEEPQTSERWRYILDSLRASRTLDEPR
jgi:transcriptional regulator with XRE-family HTH domain